MKKIILVFLTFIFIGCDSVPKIRQDNYNGEPIKVAEGIYFKKMNIQYIDVLLQCDEHGNILKNQNIPVSYNSGKVKISATTLTPIQSSSENKFNFSCVELEECYNQILIVKKSLGK